jgi:hypothetical protein
MGDQDLVNLAGQLGILTNETALVADGLRDLIRRQLLGTR